MIDVCIDIITNMKGKFIFVLHIEKYKQRLTKYLCNTEPKDKFSLFLSIPPRLIGAERVNENLSAFYIFQPHGSKTRILSVRCNIALSITMEITFWVHTVVFWSVTPSSLKGRY
jgi:hypothetical protein